jgi:putative oxidoreductase
MKRIEALTSRICPPERTRKADLGILALRLGAGGLMAGHGAQKLFGAFGGQGLEGVAGWLESMGFRPGKPWAALAGLSEFGGGTMMALGFGNPLGPIALQGAMATAARQVHWGKPIWNTEGGAELPTLYALTGLTMGLAGPGRYSLDHAFGVRVPPALAVLAGVGVAAGIAMTEYRAAQAPEQPDHAETDASQEQPAGGEDRVVETQTEGAPTDDAGFAPQDSSVPSPDVSLPADDSFAF